MNLQFISGPTRTVLQNRSVGNLQVDLCMVRIGIAGWFPQWKIAHDGMLRGVWYTIIYAHTIYDVPSVLL